MALPGSVGARTASARRHTRAPGPLGRGGKCPKWRGESGSERRSCASRQRGASRFDADVTRWALLEVVVGDVDLLQRGRPAGCRPPAVRLHADSRPDSHRGGHRRPEDLRRLGGAARRPSCRPVPAPFHDARGRVLWDSARGARGGDDPWRRRPVDALRGHRRPRRLRLGLYGFAPGERARRRGIPRPARNGQRPLDGRRRRRESFLGPAVGGLLFSSARRLPFAADAISFFAAGALLRTSIPRRRRMLRHAGGAATDAAQEANGAVNRVEGELRHGSGWTADFRAGLRSSVGTACSSCSQQRRLRLVSPRRWSLGSWSYMASGPCTWARRVRALLCRCRGYRVSRGASWAAGWSAVSALTACWLPGFSSLPSAISACPSHALAVLAAFVFGLQEVGTAIANVGSVTTRQRLIPRHLFGRVASVHRLIVGTAAPAGAIVGGLVASVSNVPLTFFIAGGVQAVLLAYLAPALLQGVKQRIPQPEVR